MRTLFLWIVEDVTTKNQYFVQKRDAYHHLVFSPLQKCTTAMKMLAYGRPTDFLDDVIRMGESTILECLKKFSSTLISVYTMEYLRPPIVKEVNRILACNGAKWFPGMLGRCRDKRPN
jgi:hypothetical protein